jgi:hypothetical protein
MKFTTETIKRVWDDENHTYIYVGPDGDGFECIELRYVDEKGKMIERITMPPEQAKLVAKAILEIADTVKVSLTNYEN